MKINLSDKNHLIIDDSAVFQPDTKIITSDGCEIVLKSPFTIEPKSDAGVKIDKDDFLEVLRYVKLGQKINAIRVYRHASCCSLADGKNYVESVMAIMGMM